MICETIFLRHTDKEGKSYVHEHRVWDRDLFLKSTAAAALKAGGKAEAITEQDFKAERQPPASRGK